MHECTQCLNILENEWACPQCGYIATPSKFWGIGLFIAFCLLFRFELLHIAISALFIFSIQSFIKKTFLLIGLQARKKRTWNLSTHEYLTITSQLEANPTHPGYTESLKKVRIYETKLAEQQVERAGKLTSISSKQIDRLYSMTCENPSLYKQAQCTVTNLTGKT